MTGNGTSTTGLFRNTNYDIISSSDGIGEITVNATRADVTCGTVTNTASSGSDACSPMSLMNATYVDYNLTMCYEPDGLSLFHAFLHVRNSLALLNHRQGMNVMEKSIESLYMPSPCMTTCQTRRTFPLYVAPLVILR